MFQDFISSIDIIGEPQNLDTFYVSFVKEGFEIIKPFADENGLSAWRMANWVLLKM